MRDTSLPRRDFLRLILLPFAASAAASLTACMMEDPRAALPPVDGDKVGFVFDNHLHDAILPKADIEAGESVTLHIQGRSAHDHVITLTAAHIAAIRAGREVTVHSSNDWGHTHDVAFNRKTSA